MSGHNFELADEFTPPTDRDIDLLGANPSAAVCLLVQADERGWMNSVQMQTAINRVSGYKNPTFATATPHLNETRQLLANDLGMLELRQAANPEEPEEAIISTAGLERGIPLAGVVLGQLADNHVNVCSLLQEIDPEVGLSEWVERYRRQLAVETSPGVTLGGDARHAADSPYRSFLSQFMGLAGKRGREFHAAKASDLLEDPQAFYSVLGYILIPTVTSVDSSPAVAPADTLDTVAVAPAATERSSQRPEQPEEPKSEPAVVTQPVPPPAETEEPPNQAPEKDTEYDLPSWIPACERKPGFKSLEKITNLLGRSPLAMASLLAHASYPEEWFDTEVLTTALRHRTEGLPARRFSAHPITRSRRTLESDLGLCDTESTLHGLEYPRTRINETGLLYGLPRIGVIMGWRLDVQQYGQEFIFPVHKYAATFIGLYGSLADGEVAPDVEQIKANSSLQLFGLSDIVGNLHEAGVLEAKKIARKQRKPEFKDIRIAPRFEGVIWQLVARDRSLHTEAGRTAASLRAQKIWFEPRELGRLICMQPKGPLDD